MLALETLHGIRVVAAPATIDSIAWPASAMAMRIAPDDVFVLGTESVGVSGEHAIVTAESGFAGCWLDASQLDHVAAHVDWSLPPLAERPALAQGFIASVPAKLYLTGATSGEHAALLLTNAPYADELIERLA